MSYNSSLFLVETLYLQNVNYSGERKTGLGSAWPLSSSSGGVDRISWDSGWQTILSLLREQGILPLLLKPQNHHDWGYKIFPCHQWNSISHTQEEVWWGWGFGGCDCSRSCFSKLLEHDLTSSLNTSIVSLGQVLTCSPSQTLIRRCISLQGAFCGVWGRYNRHVLKECGWMTWPLFKHNTSLSWMILYWSLWGNEADQPGNVTGFCSERQQIHWQWV